MSAPVPSDHVSCKLAPLASRLIGRPLVGNPTPAYRNWVLGLLAVAYAINFIDRQIISVLALDLKRDLSLDDADLGFLYGTAFGVFYALFGIPMGKLADTWNRVQLITLGLALWSGMTALSGLARTGLQLGIARIGVGVGEAAASPCAYSLIADYFPAGKRASALAVYSSGMYLGAGLSLFLGAAIGTAWNEAFPGGWHGIVGWQAAFFAVGLPGLLLAVGIAALREPQRPEGASAVSPWRDFLGEVGVILPPLALIAAARRGRQALLANALALLACFLVAALMIRLTGDVAQWLALGIGAYAVASWGMALRTRDPATFALTFGTPAFNAVLLGFGLISFFNYALIFWSMPYAESVLGADRATAGLVIGGGGAAGGFLGLNLGGRVADALKRRHASGRVLVILFAAIAPVPFLVASFTTSSLALFYALVLPMTVCSSTGLAAAAATSQDLVLPRMRGQATAIYFLSITLLGLALGPYAVGRISASTGDLATAVLCLVLVVPFTILALIRLYRHLPDAEATVEARALAAGEAAGAAAPVVPSSSTVPDSMEYSR